MARRAPVRADAPDYSPVPALIWSRSRPLGWRLTAPAGSRRSGQGEDGGGWRDQAVRRCAGARRTSSPIMTSISASTRVAAGVAGSTAAAGPSVRQWGVPTALRTISRPWARRHIRARAVQGLLGQPGSHSTGRVARAPRSWSTRRRPITRDPPGQVGQWSRRDDPAPLRCRPATTRCSRCFPR